MMKILRNIFFYLTFPIISIYYVFAMNFMYYTKENAEAWGEKLGPPWHRWILRLTGIKLEYDLSTLTPGGHYLFMANHTSNLDISAFYWLLGSKGYPVRFVAKKSLFELPLFGNCMKGARHISIDRSNRRAGMKSVTDAVERIKGGICPIIFPEGTRSSDLSTLHEFKIGGMVMALKSGIPVVPMLIDGMGEAVPKGSMIVDNSHIVRIKALEPIDPNTYTLKEREKFRDDLFELMNTEYLKMRQERLEQSEQKDQQ